MKNKKAAGLSINMVILIVLGLIALIIAVVFLRTQVTKGAEKYESISESLDKCEGFLKGRECKASCPAGKEIRPIAGAWADCGKEEGKKDKPKCCEV